MQSYPPLRPVEPRPPILPAQSSSPDNYRLPHAVPSNVTSAIPTSSIPGISPINAEAGPSTPGPAAGKKRIGVANAKKRRANAVDDGATDDGITRPPTKQREGPKKKKAQRACAHCQKAHLTCDDSRPCQRCIKRGMADKCVEGHRKKAKYLLDEAELEALKKGKTIPQNTPEGSQPPPSAQPVMEQFPSSDLYFNIGPMDQSYGFGSEAANLEYSSLSAILGMNNYSPEQPFLTSETPPSTAVAYGSQFANAAWPAEPSPPNIAPQALMGGQSIGFDGGYGGQSQQQQQQQHQQQQQQQQQQNGGSYMQNGRYASQALFDNAGASNISIQQNGREQQQLPVQSIPSDPPYSASDLSYANQPSYMQPSPPVAPSLQHQQQHQQQERLSQSQLQSASAPPMSHRSSTQHTVISAVSPPASDTPTTTTDVATPGVRSGDVASDVYSTVTKPYSYIESYQFLMSFLYKQFNKNDILRVIRALAIYRPSLIALQAPMSEEDFIFMEKCLRRSLLELEKLISYSGTPTVVWRRTGEICIVGVEFCLLTEWKREDLLTGRKYIYELFENQSVIEYWEKFASHAFENTATSVFSHCVLLKPSGEPIPCTFCFSIRRDIFDLPSVVIGQWLPLM
ncbi:hypothetical protein ACEPAG_7843 [Sanghuangporus baumii]